MVDESHKNKQQNDALSIQANSRFDYQRFSLQMRSFIPKKLLNISLQAKPSQAKPTLTMNTNGFSLQMRDVSLMASQNITSSQANSHHNYQRVLASNENCIPKKLAQNITSSQSNSHHENIDGFSLQMRIASLKTSSQYHFKPSQLSP
jgi:hypothetical protein